MSAPILNVTVDAAGSDVAIHCAGEIDLSSAPDLQQAAEETLAAEPRRVELDLRQVGFIDSSGLACVLRIAERAEAAGAAFAVLPSDQVRRLVQLSGVGLALDG